MTRIARYIGVPLYLRARPALTLILAMGIGFAWPSLAESARIGRFLTHDDLAGRMVLDQNGQQIKLPTAGDRHPALDKGLTPTYLAIPLNGGEHLPSTIPTLATGSQQGANPAGSAQLRFNSPGQPGQHTRHLEIGNRRHTQSELPGRVLATSNALPSDRGKSRRRRNEHRE